MASGNLTALAFISVSLAFITWVIYRSRILKLKERERAFDAYASKEIFNNHLKDTREGYILGQQWRLSDVHAMAKTMGVVLTKYDVMHVIIWLKRSFDKEDGISYRTIRKAIADYRTFGPYTPLPDTASAEDNFGTPRAETVVRSENGDAGTIKFSLSGMLQSVRRMADA